MLSGLKIILQSAFFIYFLTPKIENPHHIALCDKRDREKQIFPINQLNYFSMKKFFKILMKSVLWSVAVVALRGGLQD